MLAITFMLRASFTVIITVLLDSLFLVTKHDFPYISKSFAVFVASFYLGLCIFFLLRYERVDLVLKNRTGIEILSMYNALFQNRATAVVLTLLSFSSLLFLIEILLSCKVGFLIVKF